MTREFILKSLLPYKEDPSKCGYNPTSETCVYLTPDGKKCAVGQYLKTGEWQQYIGSASDMLKTYGDEILTDEAKDQQIPIGVWDSMQMYHDRLAIGSSMLFDALYRLEAITEYKFPELRYDLQNLDQGE